MIDIVQHGITTHQRMLSRQQLAAEVRRFAARSTDWLSRVRLDPAGRWYERIVLDEGHEVWLISWLPGQSTGFHDHGGSTGAFTVVWGALDERMVRSASVLVNSVGAGTVRAFGPKYVHDVMNTSAASVAVSVHAYSPPLAKMTRYDLTESGLVVTSTDGADNWLAQSAPELSPGQRARGR